MSWLSDLAGKAEDFLNKVDHSAAVAFQNEIKSPTKSSIGFNSKSAILSNYTSQSSLPSQSHFSNQHSSKLASPQKKSKTLSSSLPNTKKSVKLPDEDEKLFEFLNGSDSVAPKQSNMNENVVSSDIDNNQLQNNNKSSGTESVEKDDSEGNPSAEEQKSDLPSVTTISEQIGSSYVQHEESHELSSLELENQWLRNEVSSLNQDMGQVLQRAKAAEAELTRLKQKFNHFDAQVTQSDHVIKELHSREMDLKEAITAKDSQLAVLRVRLQEADEELQLKRKMVSQLEDEKNRILVDQNDSSGLQSQALKSLRDKLEEVERTLDSERSQFKIMQNEQLKRLQKMEEDQKQLSTNVSETQKLLSEERARCVDLSSQLRTTKNNLELTRGELSDYKQKAQKILQSKEKLIASLKEAKSSSFSGNDSEASNIASAVELEELRQERDMLREELHQSQMNIEQLRSEIQDLESQQQIDLETARDQQQNLEDQLQTEARLREDLHQECINLKEEVQYMKEELTRQRGMFQSRVQDRELEIEKLRKQITLKTMNSSQSELESRLHTLTESLIQKQTVLEALSTEKNSLVLQLERMEQLLKEHQSYSRRGHSTSVSLTVDSDAKSRIPNFLMESPFDGQVTRRMKRAYNSVDTLSVKFGVFFRRYPIARVLILIYMFILHLWVMIVLLTYTPEIHGPKENNK